MMRTTFPIPTPSLNGKGVEDAAERAGARRVRRIIERLEANAEAVLPVDLIARADAAGLVVEGRAAGRRAREALEGLR